MSKNRTHYFLLLLPLLMIVACQETNLQSNWRTPEISSNNPDTAWVRTSTYSWKDENILLGLQNDADRLIILLKTRDRATQATILRAGLTVWLDPTGKKNKSFGIHYPTSRQTRPEMPAKGQRPAGNPDEMIKQQILMPDTMEIIKRNEHVKVPIKNDLGVSVITSNDWGTITYLFNIPLNMLGDSTYRINASPGGLIGLGFETGAIDFKGKDEDRDRPSQGPGGEFGGGGGPGGPGGRPGGMPPGDRPDKPRVEPVDFWTKVVLATQETGK
jgi:hypothetical protein